RPRPGRHRGIRLHHPRRPRRPLQRRPPGGTADPLRPAWSEPMNAPHKPGGLAAGTPDVNPITAEIIRHGLLAIPKQIELNITRTAYSPLVYEYKDYAVGIVDPEGRLI